MSYQFNPFTGTFDLVTGPGGTDGQVQFNNGGSLGGATQINYDDTQGFTGFQQSTPEAPVHSAGIYGQQVTTPATISATLVEDVAISTPGSLTSSEVLSPPLPTAPTGLTITLIDQVNSATATQNTSVSGSYLCMGQTIYYRVSPYRMVSGERVCNVNFNYFTVTDYINDYATYFSVDITYSTISSNYDGFLLERSDDNYTWTYAVDVSTATTYSDTGFTTTDTHTISSYMEGGVTWTLNVAANAMFDGTPLNGPLSPFTVIDGGTGLAMIFNISGITVPSGYNLQYQSPNGYGIDFTSITSYDDYGQGSTYPYQPFSDLAFGVLNTSLTGATTTAASFLNGYSLFIEDNSYWDVDVWEYRIHPVTAEKYCVSSPDTYSLGYDSGSMSPVSFDWSTIAGNGDGRFVVLKQNGVEVAEYDAVGSTVTGNIFQPSTVSTKQYIGSYSGLPRTFNLFGKQSSPTVKYSSGAASSYFTDSNTYPYLIQHTFGSAGNATEFKLIQTSAAGNGNCYDGIITSGILQNNTPLGDAANTPTSVGYLSNGSNLNRTYKVYASKVIGGITVYSPTFATTTTTDPNNSKHYIVVLGCTAVSGASYKFTRQIGAGSTSYEIAGGNVLNDSTSTAWGASSIVTPIYGPVSGAIFERALNGSSEPPITAFRNTTSLVLAYNEFQRQQSPGLWQITGKYGVNNSTGNFFIQSQANGLEIGPYGTAHAVIENARIEFNRNYNYNSYLQFRGMNIANVMYLKAYDDTAYFGSNYTLFGYDPASTIYVTSNWTDSCITMTPGYSTSSGGICLGLKDYSGTIKYAVTNDGRILVGSSYTNNGMIRVGAGTSSYAQIYLENSSSLCTFGGSISYQSGVFYGTDASGNIRRFLQTPASYTSGSFGYINASGDIVADNRFVWNGSGLIANSQITCQAGIYISTGQALTLANGVLVSGGMRNTISAKSANYTLTQGDYAIIVNTSGKTITLPTAVSKSGQRYTIKATHTTGTTTLNTTSSQTIFTATAVTSITMLPGDCIRVMSDGANWIAI